MAMSSFVVIVSLGSLNQDGKAKITQKAVIITEEQLHSITFLHCCAT